MANPEYYNYDPSLAAATIMCVMFSLSTFSHLFDLLRSRSWYMLPFFLGCLFEAVGYGARAYSATETTKTFRPYMIQEVLILLGPTLFAASIYMILGRLVLLTEGYNQCIIRPRILTKLFILGDILSFLIQLGGVIVAGTDVSDSSRVELGSNIILGGLFVQLFFFGFFVVVAFIFNRRMKKDPTVRAQDPMIRWRHFIRVLFFVSFLVMIRSVYRVVAYIEGDDGWLITHEFALYVFDALPMFVVVTWMSMFHPSELSFLIRAEKAKLKGLRKLKSVEKYEDYAGQRA